MKAKVKTVQEVGIKSVVINVPVRYEEEDIPNDFPFRQGEIWSAEVNIDTGQIQGWPKGEAKDLYMKVCDGGSYNLIGDQGQTVATRQDYVPHGVVPGEYGDYIDLKINADGVITNWPKNPDVSAFFDNED